MAHNKTKTEHLLKERRKGAQGLIVRPLASQGLTVRELRLSDHLLMEFSFPRLIVISLWL